MTEEPRAEKPSTALSRSIGGANLTTGLSTALDAGMDAAISSLHGIPILGVVVGLARAGRDVHKELEFRKLVRFLEEISKASAERRAAFIKDLQSKRKMDDFGENMLLLLNRLDDVSKPGMVGRIMAAHIEGHITYDRAMRLCAMIARSYASDLAYLNTFRPGVQRGGTDIASMLAADGLLSQTGIDGRDLDDPESGGFTYDLNDYGRLLLKYGLSEDHALNELDARDR
jgi:hypothetical protein